MEVMDRSVYIYYTIIQIVQIQFFLENSLDSCVIITVQFLKFTKSKVLMFVKLPYKYTSIASFISYQRSLFAVMCPRGLVLVLEAPRGQRAVALALALMTKSLALVLALGPKSLALR